MKAHLTITMNNAAFEPPATAAELASILAELAANLQGGAIAAERGVAARLRDSNGNHVGEIRFTR